MTYIHRRFQLFAFCVLVVLAFPAVSMGVTHTGSLSGLSIRENPSPGPSPRECAAQAASISVSAARDHLHRVNIDMRRQFEASADYRDARLAAAQAYTAYQLSVGNALATIHQSPEYVQSQLEIDSLEAQLDAARAEAKDAGKDCTDRMNQLAIALLEHRSALSQGDANALTDVKQVSDLRYAWLDANAKVMAIESDFTERLKNDGQWREAKSHLEHAHEQLASVGP